MKSVSNEKSPLLRREDSTLSDSDTFFRPTTVTDDSIPTDFSVIPVLGELIGARNLPITEKGVEPYAIVQYGPKTLHQTKPLLNKSVVNAQDPIWSIKESPFFIVSVTQKDLSHKKPLVVALWGRYKSPRSLQQPRRPLGLFLGKIRIKASLIVDELCTEERIEYDLVDELGRRIVNDNPVNAISTTTAAAAPGGGDSRNAKLAMRFRFASSQDLQFVRAWNNATASSGTQIPRSVFAGTGVIQHEDGKRGRLVTELEEWEVPGTQFKTSLSATLRSTKKRSGKVRVKPSPDPDPPTNNTGSSAVISKAAFKETIQMPSRQWVHAGTASGSNGRLFFEILSCHDLPNVDYGNAVGNVTDAFCAVVYGDAMVQTPVIDDELSPHWPPWVQRAFCFPLQHPSCMLYVAVFGFKSGTLFNHVPLGRLEINPINFQKDTEYDLIYKIYRSSHAIDRKGRGSIRVRLRLEMDDERSFLLRSLTPNRDNYVNVRKKKSFRVARYTCYGEYDNQEKFSLGVLLAYIDELKDGFLRRILYSIKDAIPSIMFWRGQVKVGPLKLPLYSLALFCAGVVVVERPEMLPAVICLGAACLLLVNMQVRVQSPSPWHRCFSFQHYFRILLFGSSSKEFEQITTGDGWKEQEAIFAARMERIKNDEEFKKKKEAVEKAIEVVESETVQTKTRAAIIPVELLVILGKLQGIVGGFCRLCRLIDVVVTWEESNLSFLITSGLLVAGSLSLLVPWAFFLKWACRFGVLFFLGPQNKLIDIFVIKESSDEAKLREMVEMFASRLLRARCRQEEAGKLRAFRHLLYGKFATAVPSIMWTPHQDHPLPESCARFIGATQNGGVSEPVFDMCIPGQTLCGVMIPRPRAEWIVNEEERKVVKERAAVIFSGATEEGLVDPLSCRESPSPLLNEGFEVTDIYDIEALMAERGSKSTTRPNRVQRNESVRGDLGIEAVDINDDEAEFVKQSWRSSVRDIPSEDLKETLDSDDESLSDQTNDEFGRNMMDRNGRPGIVVNSAPHDGIPSIGVDEPVSPTLDVMSEDATTVSDAELYSDQSLDSHDLNLTGEFKPIQVETNSGEQQREFCENKLSSEDQGVEAVDLFVDEAAFVQQSWRSSSSSLPSDKH